MINFLQEMRAQEEVLIRDRRALHQIPELGADLPQTKAYITQRLDEEGIAWEPIGQSGIVVLLGSGTPVFMLRADMDGLPIQEETNLPFSSKLPGQAHACGHDCHAAGLLHAAILLKKHEAALPGTVKLLFQPNEEGLFGALEMIESGCLDNPKVDAALAMHVSATRPLKEVSFGEGPAFASSDVFDLEIEGHGCHAAMPERGEDVIQAAFHLALLIQNMVSREFSAFSPRVLSIASVHSDSESYNILPNKIQLRGTIRVFSEDVRQKVKDRLEEICRLGATMLKVQAHLNIHDGIPAVNCDSHLSKDLQAYANELLPSTNQVHPEPFTRMGSEDFAYYGQRIPVGYFFLGVGTDEKTPACYGAHSSKMVVNEDALYLGPAVMAHCAFRYLEEKRQQ